MTIDWRKSPFHRASPEPNTGCWLWTGHLGSKGYPQITLQGRTITASRAAYEAVHGPIGSAHVLHKCDVKTCINPDHLFLGTNADNVADKIKKDRIRHRCAVLTQGQVDTIRASKETGRALAAKYGVQPQTISSIRNYRTWK